MPQDVNIISGSTTEVGTARLMSGQGESLFIEPAWNAARIALRPLDYTTAGSLLGHYRAVSKSGAASSVTAAAILACMRFVDLANPTRFLVLTRLAAQVELTVSQAAAAAIDLQAFVFRGATGNASGAGSTTLTLTGNNQKSRIGMGSSILGSGGGEIRTFGTTTFLTAAAGKTNDGAPFGFAMYPTGLFGSTATGTATATGIAGAQGQLVELYKADGPYFHPIVLANNEGIEIQAITAGPVTASSLTYGFLWEWAEVAVF